MTAVVDRRLVVQTWLGTRLLLLVVACLVMVVDQRTPADCLANWDVQHFFAIAERGYTEDSLTAFFPGWPLMLRGLAALGVPLLVGGCALAAVGSALAAAALYRLGGPGAAIVWLLAPTAVFTLVPYTESVFCAAAFWAWERASARHWGQAAALAAVAASVRVSGLFLVGALLILALTQRGDGQAPMPWRSKLAHAAWLLLPAGVLFAYAAFLHLRTGSWLAWYQAQSSGWVRGFTWPWDSFWHTLDPMTPGAYPEHPEWSWVFRAEMLSMAVGVVVTVACLVRRRLAEASWVGVQVLAFSLSYWFFSVNRAVLLWFPLWTWLGGALNQRPGGGGSARPGAGGRAKGGLAVAAAAVALAVQALWAWLFYTGRWAS
ncbi:MAG: hypothetical protein LBR32_05115 [Propionibacteriaceae bacterium]|nr:hypothetical protein [Propionibacteriaceae bacterium]